MDINHPEFAEHQNESWRWAKDYSEIRLINTPWLRLVEPTGPDDVVYVGDCIAHKIPMSQRSFEEQQAAHKVDNAYERLARLALSDIDDLDEFMQSDLLSNYLDFVQWEVELRLDDES